jgi:tyrosine-protein phosphatase SIW14
MQAVHGQPDFALCNLQESAESHSPVRHGSSTSKVLPRQDAEAAPRMRSSLFRWTFGIILFISLVGISFGYFRLRYDHSKRLRVVTPGKIYRSGQLTASGLEEAIERFHIRTVLNLQNEAPDPELDNGMRESDYVRSLGVRYAFIDVDLLDKWQSPELEPTSLDGFYALLDDPDNFPLLIHCRAGLHRTGIFTAIYRMEYEGWTRDQAIAELKSHGFGDTQCTSRNEYIKQYLLQHQPRTQRAGQRITLPFVGAKEDPATLGTRQGP